MTVKDLSIIKEFEGLKLVSYPDKKKGTPVWTVGFGTTRYYGKKAVEPGDVITEEEANNLLRYDIMNTEAGINKYIKVPLTQSQFDSLVSLVYNIGVTAFKGSTLARKLNKSDYIGASYQFSRWVYDDGLVVKGLINRRLAERDLFLKGFKIVHSKLIKK